MQPEFAEEPGRPGLAVEGPHRPRRGGRDHREGPRRAGAPYLAKCGGTYSSRVVLVEDPALPAHRPEGVRRGLRLGRAGRLRARLHHRQPRPAHACRAASAPPATRPCTTTSGAACPARSSSPALDPDLAELRDRYAAQAVPADQKAGRADRRGGRARSACRPGIPVAVGAFDAHMGAVGRGHQARHAGQDHRHQHLRHDGRPDGPAAGRHPRAVRHRARLDHPRHVRPGGRPVGRGRHLQLVRQPPGPRQYTAKGDAHANLTREAAEAQARARAACWPSTGTTATARSWSIRC